MKPWLNSYASNVYSQFGEDGVLEFVLDRIGVQSKIAVEAGASDGISCSNTAHLWRDQGWFGFLVEPDAERFDQLEGNAGPFNTVCRRAFVTPTGPYSISSLLEEHDITDVDYMSIDVDGADAHIFEALECRPRIISCEFNPLVHPSIALRQRDPEGCFGASLLALIRIGQDIDYMFIGATYCNAFFVDASEAGPFADYETDPEVLFAKTNYTYAVTDFAGRVALAGESLPWGAHEPLVTPLVGAQVTPVTQTPQQLRRGFESLWGPALWLPASWANVGDPEGAAPGLLDRILRSERPQLVCLDLSNEPNLTATEWIHDLATERGYKALLVGRVLGLVLA